MNSRFLSWYSEASVDLDRQAVPLREEAIGKMKNDIVGADLPDLVRLALRLPTQDNGVTDWLTEGFQANDPKFSASANFERQILAGALLVELMDPIEKDPVADAAALTLLAASFRGDLPGEYQRDFVAHAKNYLWSRSRALRLEFKWPTLKASSFSVDANSASNLAVAAADLDKAGKAIAALHKQLQQFASAAEEKAALQQEEIDVAWWVFGGRLRASDILVQKADPAAAPFLIGAELGQLISVVPGPVSAEGLLDRMLDHLGDKRAVAIPVRTVLSGTPESWKSSWIAALDSDVSEAEVLPLAALVAKAAQGADPGEIDSWARRSLGLDPAMAQSSLQVATQVYTETAAARALAASWESSE